MLINLRGAGIIGHDEVIKKNTSNIYICNVLLKINNECLKCGTTTTILYVYASIVFLHMNSVQHKAVRLNTRYSSSSVFATLFTSMESIKFTYINLSAKLSSFILKNATF